LAVILGGCGGSTEDLPTGATATPRSISSPLVISVVPSVPPSAPAPPPGSAPTPRATPAASPTPTPPPAASPSPTATPGTTPTPSPVPTPSATPTPQPTATPTPQPTPSGQCDGLEVTIGGSCAGASPNCGITDPKNPVVKAKDSAGVVLDASYFIGSPKNKVHAGDACYPGPIQSWKQFPPGSVAAVSCSEPFSNNHVMKCGGFDKKGDFQFQACGQGLCGSIVVSVQ